MTKWRDRIVGLDQEVPLLDGRMVPYINLDNAASTPPLREVVDVVQYFLRYYSSVHRGTGFKSRVSTAAYDEAHDAIAHFVGADTRTNTAIFVKNTTEAINKLAFRAFNIHGVHHALVAAILGYEAGIGVRSGCFCAQPYVACLLGLARAGL